jgi:ABC-type multidrug transport system ATPase subunit
VTESPVLEIEALTERFDDVTALDDVSLTLDAGSVGCLVGPNGSGKTTLLRSAAGLLEPTSGTVEVATTTTRSVGYLPQTPAFRPSFTVAETLAFYASLVPDPVDVDAALDRVGLGAVSDRQVGALSGGMVRLLGLAQATIGSPGLLVLDEPASGLDPQISRRIADAIADVAAEGTAVLLATHDLVAVSRIADQVFVLDRGRILERGTPSDLLREAEADDLDAALATLLGRGGEAVAVQTGRLLDEGGSQ